MTPGRPDRRRSDRLSSARLPVRHVGSPLRTNAAINREHAATCYAAGMTVEEIAAEWPEVFTVTQEAGGARLGQKYEYALGDGSGRYETSRLITAESVRAAIARFKGGAQ